MSFQWRHQVTWPRGKLQLHSPWLLGIVSFRSRKFLLSVLVMSSLPIWWKAVHYPTTQIRWGPVTNGKHIRFLHFLKKQTHKIRFNISTQFSCVVPRCIPLHSRKKWHVELINDHFVQNLGVNGINNSERCGDANRGNNRRRKWWYILETLPC